MLCGYFHPLYLLIYVFRVVKGLYKLSNEVNIRLVNQHTFGQAFFYWILGTLMHGAKVMTNIFLFSAQYLFFAKTVFSFC